MIKSDMSMSNLLYGFDILAPSKRNSWQNSPFFRKIAEEFVKEVNAAGILKEGVILESRHLINEGFWDTVQSGVGNFAGGLDGVLKKIGIKKEPEGYEEAQRIFNKVLSKESNKKVKELIDTVMKAVEEMEIKRGTKEKNRAFPVNKHADIFIMGCEMLASAYDTLKASVEKKEYPVVAGNEMINALRIAVEKFARDTEREKGGMYASFGGGGKKAGDVNVGKKSEEEPQSKMAAEGFGHKNGHFFVQDIVAGRLSSLLFEADEAQSQETDPDEALAKKLGDPKNKEVLDKLTSMDPVKLVAKVGLATGLLGAFFMSPLFTKFIKFFFSENVVSHVTNQEKAAEEYLKSQGIATNGKLTQTFHGAMKANGIVHPDIGNNTASNIGDFKKFLGSLGGLNGKPGDIDAGRALWASACQDPKAAQQGLDMMLKMPDTANYNSAIGSATKFSGLPGKAGYFKPASMVTLLVRGVREITKETTKAVTTTKLSSTGAALLKGGTALGPWAAGIGLGALAAAGTVALIRKRAKKKSRLGILTDLKGQMADLPNPGGDVEPPAPGQKIKVVITLSDDGATATTTPPPEPVPTTTPPPVPQAEDEKPPRPAPTTGGGMPPRDVLVSATGGDRGPLNPKTGKFADEEKEPAPSPEPTPKPETAPAPPAPNPSSKRRKKSRSTRQGGVPSSRNLSELDTYELSNENYFIGKKLADLLFEDVTVDVAGKLTIDNKTADNHSFKLVGLDMSRYPPPSITSMDEMPVKAANEIKAEIEKIMKGFDINSPDVSIEIKDLRKKKESGDTTTPPPAPPPKPRPRTETTPPPDVTGGGGGGGLSKIDIKDLIDLVRASRGGDPSIIVTQVQQQAQDQGIAAGKDAIKKIVKAVKKDPKVKPEEIEEDLGVEEVEESSSVKPPVPVPSGKPFAVAVFTGKKGVQVYRVLSKRTLTKYASATKGTSADKSDAFSDMAKRYDDSINKLKSAGLFVDPEVLKGSIEKISTGRGGDHVDFTYNQKGAEKKGKIGGFSDIGPVSQWGEPAEETIRAGILSSSGKEVKGAENMQVVYLVTPNVLSAVQKAAKLSADDAKSKIADIIKIWADSKKAPKASEMQLDKNIKKVALDNGLVVESAIRSGTKFMKFGTRELMEATEATQAQVHTDRLLRLAGLR